MIPTAHICRCRQILFLKLFSRWAGFLATKNQTEGYLCKDKFDLLILIRQTSPTKLTVLPNWKKIIRLVKLATLHFFFLKMLAHFSTYTCMIQQFVSVDIPKMFTHHLSCRNSRFFLLVSLRAHFWAICSNYICTKQCGNFNRNS